MRSMSAARARAHDRGQALVEFALVFPLFLLLLMSIITFGLYVFYNQQLQNAAREGARYAAVHSSTAQRPTVSWINPIGSNRPETYERFDAPENGWPDMTGAARSKVWGMASNQVSLTACWSGYIDPATTPPNADVMPTAPGATFADCTMSGVNPRTNPDGLACPAPATIPSAGGLNSGHADGDDKASDLAYANTQHYPTTVTVYACFNWRPPMAGFVLIPDQIPLRAVITEVLQRQQ
jgi:Flp pilus assembly protein TadG